jgi:hypothetical protein
MSQWIDPFNIKKKTYQQPWFHLTQSQPSSLQFKKKFSWWRWVGNKINGEDFVSSSLK